MAAKPDIWMPLYIGDYLAATTHLSASESGAYLHLLMHQWRNNVLPAESEGLRRIARIEADAWSIAWPVLKPFFDFTTGAPMQLRLEEIRVEWVAKKAKAVEKAKTAADKRWNRVAVDAPSIAQAMLQTCPSPSPSPIEKNTKTIAQASPSPVQSSPSAEKKADPRHTIFKAALFGWWERTLGEGKEPAWGGDIARHLDDLLRSMPALTVERFDLCLKHRGRSDVNLSENPRKWLRNVTDYELGPLDAYGKPKSLSKNAPQPISRRAPGPQETYVALKRKDDAKESVLNEWRPIKASRHPDYAEAPGWVKRELDGQAIGMGA